MVPANFSDLAEKVRPGVVNIQVVKTVKNAGYGVPFPFRTLLVIFLALSLMKIPIESRSSKG